MVLRTVAIVKSRAPERVKCFDPFFPMTDIRSGRIRAGGSTCDMLTNSETQN